MSIVSRYRPNRTLTAKGFDWSDLVKDAAGPPPAPGPEKLKMPTADLPGEGKGGPPPGMPAAEGKPAAKPPGILPGQAKVPPALGVAPGAEKGGPGPNGGDPGEQPWIQGVPNWMVGAGLGAGGLAGLYGLYRMMYGRRKKEAADARYVQSLVRRVGS